MPKTLISVRLSGDLLDKIELFKHDRNKQFEIQRNHSIYSREASLLGHGYYDEMSTADVIELALLSYFTIHNITDK